TGRQETSVSLPRGPHERLLPGSVDVRVDVQSESPTVDQRDHPRAWHRAEQDRVEALVRPLELFRRTRAIQGIEGRRGLGQGLAREETHRTVHEAGLETLADVDDLLDLLRAHGGDYVRPLVGAIRDVALGGEVPQGLAHGDPAHAEAYR